MAAFLVRIWAFVRPYRFRFGLGLFSGVLYGLSNGVLVLVIRPVVNLVFTHSVDVRELLARTPALVRPLTDWIAAQVPSVTAPSSKTGMVLVICLIPAVMLVRVLLAYLNIYLVNWSAARAIADIRTKLFDHLQNLSLGFFSRARTGDLISRITNDTQILYGIIGNSLASMIKDPITIVAVLAVALSRQPRLTLISIVVLPLCLVPVII
jgi:ABC-type multidrug transport system fused ATPase/permease subunit